MATRICFALIWLAFSLYAFLLAPPPSPDTVRLIVQLSTGQWSDINPLVIALFNLMGVWPLIYCCLLFADGRGQKIPAWPFASLSFVVGAFGLLPYLVLRHPQPTFSGPMDRTLTIFDSRWMGLALSVLALTLLGYGLLQGNWPDFIHQWKSSRFIHVMAIDFCLLCVLFPSLLRDDLARHGVHQPALFWAVSLVPLLGPLFYLCSRPAMQSGDGIQQTRPR